MSHPRTVLTADAWENLEKRYRALIDEYKAHQEIIDQDNVYQRFFAKVEEQYATLIKARSQIPTADAMVEDMKWEEKKHLDIIKRNEEIISRINDSKQIQKYSALITNLRPLTHTIEEQTEQIQDKEAQITALSQENKSTNFGAKTARNLFNIEILKRDIRTLEADKKRNLDLLCNKINQSGE